MIQDPFKANEIHFAFESTIPPYKLETGEIVPYRIAEIPYLKGQMTLKIEGGIKQFGTLEKFVETFRSELEEKRVAAEYAVRSFEMRRLQLEFIEKHYLKCVQPVEGLDPK